MNKTGVQALLAAVLCSSISLTAQAGSQKQSLPNKAEAVPGEIVLSLRTSESFALKAAQAKVITHLSKILGTESFSFSPLEMDASIAKVVLKDASKTEEVISSLTHSLSAEVSAAEPNYIYHAFGTVSSGVPNDPSFTQQWDMLNTGQTDAKGQTGTTGSDINVAPLWKNGITGDRSLIVAVIDTGVDYNHPDLAVNVFKNLKEIPGNGIDDDNNGVIDDVYGANFSNGTEGNGLDDHNHGSHCAGSIGGVGNDGTGISGVNWTTTILPVKFLTASGGGSLTGAINAVKYATKMGAKVMSNSWGGGSFSQILLDAIKDAEKNGALFVAAAGNNSSNNDAYPSYPASYKSNNIVSVAATDNRDQLAKFSNYGKTSVHVAAPGVNIYSTVKGGGYATYSGTSMATPHVAGIAALIWGVNPSWDYADVKKRLITTSTPVASLKYSSVSGGRVNAYNAFYGIKRKRR